MSMLRKMIAVLVVMITANVFAAPVFPVTAASLSAGASCGLVNSYTDPNFCAEFKTVTLCYCDAKFPAKLQPLFCPSVSRIYNQAMALYHALPNLCRVAVNNHQSASLLECENQWSCVMTGKTYSGGRCPSNPSGDLPCPNIN
jgi:hypothetical protein